MLRIRQRRARRVCIEADCHGRPVCGIDVGSARGSVDARQAAQQMVERPILEHQHDYVANAPGQKRHRWLG